MASARIEAAAVYCAAEAKREEALASQEEAKAAWFELMLRKPIKRGALWWRYDHYRSQVELEALYVHTDDCHWRSAEMRVEGMYWEIQNKAARFRELARAALSRTSVQPDTSAGVGDGYVTLDADEVRFLGLQAAS